MPTLASYSRMAPFTLEELVEAANSLLRNRPRLLVSRRTVRYYISQGIVPPPAGSPKFARYEMDHLLALVAARCLLDEGESLGGVKPTLDRLLSSGASLEKVQGMLDRTMPDAPFVVHESRANFGYQPQELPERTALGRAVLRLQLTPDATLEISAESESRAVLGDAATALQSMIRKLDNST